MEIIFQAIGNAKIEAFLKYGKFFSYLCRTTGCGAVGSALGLGPRCRTFESCHPDPVACSNCCRLSFVAMEMDKNRLKEPGFGRILLGVVALGCSILIGFVVGLRAGDRSRKRQPQEPVSGVLAPISSAEPAAKDTSVVDTLAVDTLVVEPVPEKTPSEKPVQEPSEAPQVEPAETFSSESAPEAVDVPADTSVSASVETTSVETTADVTSDAANSGDGQTRVCLTALVQTSEGDVLHLYNIYPSDTNPHAGQDVVWMGGIGITDSVIMKSIASFNKNSSNGIWVKVYDYGDFRYTGTYGTKKYRDKAMENMVAQINSGTGPDIIISTEDSASLDNSHALTNLNGYVDGISGLKREEYFDSALRAFETDGKLYSIPLGFKVNALLGNPSYVDGKTEMNYHDFSSARALLQENIMLFSGMTLESMMNMFVEGETYSWINYGSDKVTIDKSALIDMLELLKLEMINNEGEIYGMNDDYDYTLDPYPFDGFDDVYGSFAAFCPGSVNTLYEYSLGGVVGDNTEWYGYPGSSGCTPIVEASMTAGIASYSTQKDKAWDVISYLLSEEVQSEINSLQSPTPYASYVEGAIPVNIAAFRKLNELRYKQSGQGYVDETGRTILIGQAEMADLLDNYEAWLQKPLRRYVRDDEVLAVVRRVTASYLDGEINVTEAAETIEKELTSIFE